MWAEVLGHRDFGVTDNFFTVGGHSLAAARLQAKFKELLGQQFPLSLVFQLPTVQEQAEWLTGQHRAVDDCLVPLQPRGDLAPMFVVHGWGGGVFHLLDLARAMPPGRPVLGLQFTGDEPPQCSVTGLAARYADRILEHRPHGPIHLLGTSAGGWYAYAVAAALLDRGAQVGLLAILDSHAVAHVHRRLRLARLRMKLLRLINPPAGEPRWGFIRGIPLRRRAASTVSDPFVELLRQEFRPPRLPITADLFGPPQTMDLLQRTWSFYALAGVRSVPLFTEHNDFLRPELAPRLAAAIDDALIRNEQADHPGKPENSASLLSARQRRRHQRYPGRRRWFPG